VDGEAGRPDPSCTPGALTRSLAAYVEDGVVRFAGA
jgi:hypothetical protein